MGWPQFLAWAATQGFKNIKVLRQAYNSFKKFPGKDVVLKTAKNLWDDVIKKTSTKDLAAKVRQGYKKRPFPGFKPKIVKNKWTDKHGQTWMRDEKGNPIQITEGLGKYKWWKAQADAKRKIVPKKPNPLTDALKAGKYKKVPTPKKLTPKTEIDKVLEKIGIKDKIFIDKSPLKGPRIFDFGSNVIKFPKKPPGKADGGSIDKALPKKSRDI
jgi:hypothetical protein